MEKTTKITHNGMLSAKFAHLRRQAEERVKQWPNLSSQSQADLHKVVYELKIHLAELEIQNEELKRGMKAVIEQQDKDAKMYDFGLSKEKPLQFRMESRRVRPHREAVSQGAYENE